MSGPNFRMLVRHLRLIEEAKAANKCPTCNRKLPKLKPSPKTSEENS